MDELGLTAADVADALGVTPQTVRQMRMDPSAAGYRTPPEAWPAVLAKLARARGGEMQKLADRIERQSR